MKRLALAFLALLAATGAGESQIGPGSSFSAKVQATCGALSLTVGSFQPINQDATGKLCTSGSGPATCSNALDFSASCNSQYIGAL